MGRKVGRNRGGARGRARAGIGIAAFVALAAVGLSACFAPAPKPNPPAPPAPPSSTTSSTTTTTTTAPPPAAHLVASPSTLNFNVEVTTFPPTESHTITITNDGNAPSGVLGLPDLTGLDPPGSPGANLFAVGNYNCSTALAPGDSCTFDLGFMPSGHQNPAPWTGHLHQSATPGGTLDVQVNAQYTSKIEYSTVSPLNPTVAAPAASEDFVVKNASAGDMTLSSFNLNTIGGMPPTAGTFAFGTDAGSPVQACTSSLVLHAGDSCYWTVTYTNGTGAGTNNAQLQFTLGGIPNGVLFAGAGNP